jgi:hypothetical protein
MKFTNHFDDVVGAGESITTESGSFKAIASVAYDESYHIDDDDCHHPDQKVTGCNDEHYAELLAARKAWVDNEWYYGVLTVDVYFNNHKFGSASLFGLEINYPKSENNPNPNNYLQDVANELLSEAMADAMETLADLVNAYHKECTV